MTEKDRLKYKILCNKRDGRICSQCYRFILVGRRYVKYHGGAVCMTCCGSRFLEELRQGKRR